MNEIDELTIDRGALELMRRALCRASDEAGGILGGPSRARISEFFFDSNARTAPNCYRPCARDLRRAVQLWSGAGLSLLGFVHSHPAGRTRLSAADLHYGAEFLRLNPAFDSIYMCVLTRDGRLCAYELKRSSSERAGAVAIERAYRLD